MWNKMEKVAKKSVWFEEKSRFYTVSEKQNRVFHKVFQVFPTVLHKQILKITHIKDQFSTFTHSLLILLINI